MRLWGLKKLLMVEYNFPPKIGVGVIRTVKLAKYLPQHGWRPIILSAKPSWRDRRIEYIEEEEIRNLKAYRARELVRLNKMIKRDVHLGWSFPAFVRGLKIIKGEGIDAIYATYPYAVNMLVGSLLKRITAVPFLANYKDLWTNSFFPSPSVEFSAQKAMEEFVLRSADAVVTVTPSHIEDLRKFFPFLQRIYVIRNGYDPADFKAVTPVKFSKFTILHAGSVTGTRVARFIKFLLALRDFHDPKDFQLVLLGNVDSRVRDLIKQMNLGDLVKIVGVRPHKEAIRWIMGADVLLLVPAAKYIPTMKLYEYLASGKFILNIGYEFGEAGKLISKCKAGVSVIPDQTEIKKIIREVVYGSLINERMGSKREEIEKFSWPRLANRLASVLNYISN